jgi:2,4-dienoyl-CoA reductase-like NADH-dependent reductase (Old Yellow Enzyme family)
MGVGLTEPFSIGGLEVPNRLYRAPLLECAGNGPGAVEALIEELEPAAASGAGLLFQGATIVREKGGCAAPNMTRVADPGFVSDLTALTDRIHDHGAAIAIQLEHGGLRSREVWHAGYRGEADEQLAVSRPPWPLRALDHLGLIELSPRVMSTPEVEELAADFGRSAAWAVDAGYDAIHLAGANMGIVQQFLSPFYNRRDDAFADGVRFLEAVHDEVRDRAGDVPLVTKVPDETPAPFRRRLSTDDAVSIARRLEAIGYDAVVPVRTSVFWDASIIRGSFPDRAWDNEAFAEAYAEAFGSRLRTRLLALGNRIQSRLYEFEPGWNEELCRRVSAVVSVPVLIEGGIRERDQIDRLLESGVCEAVGIGRPFYAEPRLPARLLAGGDAICESCNNCVIPQAVGEPGVCRTPAVLERRGTLERENAYDRRGNDPSGHTGRRKP